MSYASGTGVSVERSQREIEQLVRAAGASSFYRGQQAGRAVVGFELKDRRILFELPMPGDEEFATFKRRGRVVQTPPHQVEQLRDQAERAKWRALALCIKAKLVSVDSGVESFEEAFMANVVVQHEGKAMRFAAVALKAIGQAYRDGELPPLLPSGGA